MHTTRKKKKKRERERERERLSACQERKRESARAFPALGLGIPTLPIMWWLGLTSSTLEVGVNYDTVIL